MKKVFFLAIAIAIGVFYACESETIEDKTVIESTEVNDVVEADGKWSPFVRCYYIFERGLKIRGNCYSWLNGICSVKKICIPILIDPCWFVPCWIDIFDPWIIYEKLDPRDFLSIRDKLDVDIDPREAAIPFALNEQVAGLQFYQEEGLFKDNVYTVKDALILDAEVSKGLGLQGNVVKAGKYPVIKNKENGTFNVILSVEKGFKQ